LTAMAGCNCCDRHDHDADDREEAGEMTMQLNELPSSVRTALERETRGGTIREVERESLRGRTVYSADAMVDGEMWEIEVAEDGSVLSRERDDEEDGDGPEDDD